MDVVAEFAAAVHRPADDVVLDEAALLIGAAAEPGADLDGARDRLDRLAATAPEGGLEPLLAHLFGPGRLRGDVDGYGDPVNSYLHRVLDRGLGIPISLSVVAIGVGRRIGVPIAGVGMPGHFLITAAEPLPPQRWYDPFDGGRPLDVAAARRLHAAVLGWDAPFSPAQLEPVGPHEVLARTLRNLRATFLARGDRDALLGVLRLRAVLPATDVDERAELASVLAACGDFVGAADELTALAEEVGGGLGDRFRGSAERLRARLN